MGEFVQIGFSIPLQQAILPLTKLSCPLLSEESSDRNFIILCTCRWRNRNDTHIEYQIFAQPGVARWSWLAMPDDPNPAPRWRSRSPFSPLLRRGGREIHRWQRIRRTSASCTTLTRRRSRARGSLRRAIIFRDRKCSLLADLQLGRSRDTWRRILVASAVVAERDLHDSVAGNLVVLILVG